MSFIVPSCCPPVSFTLEPVTLQARVQSVTPGSPWLPAAVTGVLTSLTATGITGTWNVDPTEGATVTGLPAGLSLSWSADDSNTLTGFDSISADTTSSVVVNWTER